MVTPTAARVLDQVKHCVLGGDNVRMLEHGQKIPFPHNIFFQFLHILGCRRSKRAKGTGMNIDRLEHHCFPCLDLGPYKNAAITPAGRDLVIKIVELA